MNKHYALIFGVSVIAAVMLFAFSNSDEPTSITGKEIRSTEGGLTVVKTLVPEVSSASQYTTKADSHSADALDSYKKKDWDLSGPQGILDADAVSTNEIEIQKWRFSDAAGGYAFDSDGNLFAHDDEKVNRIDVSNGEQTVWTMPEGWTGFADDGIDIDSSGFYYFVADHKLSNLNPDTGEFTQWNVYLSVDDSLQTDDNIYFTPYRTLYLAEPQGNLGVYEISKSFNDLIVGTNGASGHVDIEIISPDGEIRSEQNYAGLEGRTSISVYFFKDLNNILDSEFGNYTVRVSDMFQTIEIPFEINEAHQSPVATFLNREPILSETSEVFLQKLDPSTNVITNYISNVTRDNSVNIIPSGYSGYLYLTTYTKPYSSENLVGIMQFDPNTGDIIHWPNVLEGSHQSKAITISDGVVYLGNHVGRDTLKLTTLDTQDNTLSELIVPYRCNNSINGMVVDSLGTVYFHGCDNGLYQFVPSTGIFTKFYYTSFDFLKIDSSDVIYWADSDQMGTIDFVQTSLLQIMDVGTISPTEIQIRTDAELFSTSRIFDYHFASSNGISDITLDGTTILITVANAIEHDDILKISYFEDNIRGVGGKYLESFTDLAVTNNVEMLSEADAEN